MRRSSNFDTGWCIGQNSRGILLAGRTAQEHHCNNIRDTNIVDIADTDSLERSNFGKVDSWVDTIGMDMGTHTD